MFSKFFKNKKKQIVDDDIKSIIVDEKNSSIELNDFKQRFGNSFNSGSFKYYRSNKYAEQCFKIDYESLRELFKVRSENLDVFYDYFINYNRYNKYRYVENKIIEMLIKDFHRELFYSIEHHLYYFENAFKNNTVVIEKFYNKLDLKSIQLKLYIMAFDSLEVNNDEI